MENENPTEQKDTNTSNMVKKGICAKLQKVFASNWIKWILLILILLVAYLIFFYDDVVHTIDNSITFAKSIFNGKLLQFYELSVELARRRYAANYSTLIYIIYAIWNLPVWALSGILGVDDFSTWTVGVLWGKTLIVIATLAVTYLIYKILLLCNVKKEKAYLATFLFLSSMIVFDVIFVTVQLDIIAILFMLLGVYGYIKKNDILFFVSFMIAVPLKMFAILLALPLILLRQKNLLKAGGTLVGMTSLLIIEKILYSGSAVYKYALGAQSRDAIYQLLNSRSKHRKTDYDIFSTLYLPISVHICS